VTWILWRQSHISLEVEVPIIYSHWPNLIVLYIKPIAAELKCSQLRYSFFEVVHFLYSSDVDIRSLLSILIEGPEEDFREHSSKPSTKSYRR